MILRNKSGSTIKKGFLVKSVRGGFDYAKAGDVPIGVIVMSAPKSNFAIIKDTGIVDVYVDQLSVPGKDIRMPVEGEGGRAGVGRNIGSAEEYVSIGQAIEAGKGLIKVALNIRSVGAGGGGDVEEAPIDGTPYSRQDAGWVVASTGLSDAPASGSIGALPPPIAYGRYNGNWVDTGLIIDYSGGTGIMTAIVEYGQTLSFNASGDLTVAYAADPVTGNKIITYGHTASPIYTDWKMYMNGSEQAAITSGYYADWSEGAGGGISLSYTELGSPPVHSIAIDVDQVWLDTFIDTYNFLTSGPNDGYDYVWEGTGWSRNMLTIKYNGGTSTDYLNVGDNTNSDTIEFLASGDLTVSYVPGSAPGAAKTVTFGHTPTAVYTDWNLYMNSIKQADITSGDYMNFAAGAGIGLAFTSPGSPVMNTITITNSSPSKWTASGSNIYYNTGNVGIGQTTPTTNLHVGSGSFSTYTLAGIGITNGASAYSFFSASDGTKQWIGGIDNTITYGKEGMVSNHPLSIITNNTSKIYIETDGDVRFRTGAETGEEGTYIQHYYSSGNYAGRLFMQEGTSSGLYGFSIINAGSDNPTFNGTGFTLTGNITYFIEHNNNATGTICMNMVRSTGQVNLYYGGSVKLATTSTGISVTGDVVASTSVAANTYFRSTDNAAVLGTASAGTVYLRPSTYLSATGEANLNTTRFYVSSAIQSAGEITSYSSDARLKNNIRRIPNALDAICSLDGVFYDWNDNVHELGFYPSSKSDVGFIAQDFEKHILGGSAPAPFDRDEKGNSISGENYLTVMDKKAIPYLVEAIKELNAKLERYMEEHP